MIRRITSRWLRTNDTDRITSRWWENGIFVLASLGHDSHIKYKVNARVFIKCFGGPAENEVVRFVKVLQSRVYHTLKFQVSWTLLSTRLNFLTDCAGIKKIAPVNT